MTTSIKCGKCGMTHASVQEVRDCYVGLVKETPAKRPATERQIDYAQSLTRKRVPLPPVQDIELSNSIEAACEFINGLSFEQISEYIGAMKNQPLRETKMQAPLRPLVGEGMYKVGDDVFRVQVAVHGSGHLYVKRWNGSAFVRAPGVLASLSEDDRMSLEDAQEFGALYGVCCVCGRTLTDEVSIANGIGPICAGKEGWFR